MVKNAARRLAGKAGCSFSATVSGRKSILGSFPQCTELNAIGSQGSCFIHGGYVHRPAPECTGGATHLIHYLSWNGEIAA
jgi:hypothetical protein